MSLFTCNVNILLWYCSTILEVFRSQLLVCLSQLRHFNKLSLPFMERELTRVQQSFPKRFFLQSIKNTNEEEINTGSHEISMQSAAMKYVIIINLLSWRIWPVLSI